jgi:hypothetical protein
MFISSSSVCDVVVIEFTKRNRIFPFFHSNFNIIAMSVIIYTSFPFQGWSAPTWWLAESDELPFVPVRRQWSVHSAPA